VDDDITIDLAYQMYTAQPVKKQAHNFSSPF